MAKPRHPLSVPAAGVVLVGLVSILGLLAACNAPATETPTTSSEASSDAVTVPPPEPTPAEPVGPRVEVLTGGAIVNASENTAALAEGEVAEIGVGAQVSVADDGRARITYPGAADESGTAATDAARAAGDRAAAPDFLFIDLPRRVDLEVVAAEPADRSSELALSGVARMTVGGADEADVLVATDAFEVRVAGAPADVLAITCVDPDSIDKFPAAAGACPGDAPGGWVAVVFGSAEATDASPTDAAAPESLITALEKGQAAAYAANGSVIAVLDLGVAAIEAWYQSYLDGSDEPLAAIPTPTPTAQVPVAAVADPVFAAERQEIGRGECTTIEWDVPDVSEVVLGGAPQTNPGQVQVCPEETTTYWLEWTAPDGSEHELELVVRVSDQSGTSGDDGGTQGGGGGSDGSGGDGGGDDGSSGDRPPYPTRTPCATREACPIPSLDPDATAAPTWAPPTQAPTDEPPTDPPPTQPPPTDEPATQPPATEPAASPEPATQPPAPEPTDEPAATPDP